MIEIVPQNIDKLSISSIEKIYGSKIKLFNNDIEINNLKNIHEDEFYIMYSYSKDVICSLYLDKFQCQYMNGFEYLSDENIFALDVNKILHKWNFLNLLRIHINSENTIDIDKDKNLLKMIYAFTISVEGYIHVTEFIPNIQSGLYPVDEWVNFL